VRKEREVLEDDAGVTSLGRDEAVLVGDRLAGEGDDALARLLEARDHPQRRRLPTARGAEERQQFAAFDLQRDVLDDGFGAEPLANEVHREDGFIGHVRREPARCIPPSDRSGGLRLCHR